MVGRALAQLPAGPAGAGIPWQRVVNAQGRVSVRGGETGARRRKRLPRQDGVTPETRQQRLLEAEGVEFRDGRLSLERYRWNPAERALRPVAGALARAESRAPLKPQSNVQALPQTKTRGRAR
jgi:alkylated DNA nucleotide flippase Atl1